MLNVLNANTINMADPIIGSGLSSRFAPKERGKSGHSEDEKKGHKKKKKKNNKVTLFRWAKRWFEMAADMTQDNATLSYFRAMLIYWISLPVVIVPIAVMWFYFMQSEIFPASEEIVIALQDFGIFVSFILFEYIRDAWKYYTTGPTFYKQLLNNLTTICTEFYGLLLTNRMVGGNKQTENNGKSISIEYTHSILLRFLSNLECLMMPYKMEFDTDRQIKGLKEPDSPIDALKFDYFHLLTSLRTLEDIGAITAADFGTISSSVKQLMSSVDQVDVNYSVDDLSPMYWHTIVVLGMYFMVLLPYKLAISTSWSIFFIYPITTFAIFGVILIRKYVGSPFRKNPRFVTIDFDAWKYEAKRTIEKTRENWENSKE